MKKYLIPLFLLIFFPLFVSNTYAYTEDEVSQHNTESDCWVMYDNGVYDITNYVAQHDKYLDIRSWCGTDMTTAFETKDGEGLDHKSSSYSLLETFYIGSVDSVTTTTTVDTTDTSITSKNIDESTTVSSDTSTSDETISKTSGTKEKNSNPYNIWIPLIVTLTVYWGSFLIYGKFNLVKFNGFWNTVLLLTLIIPSFAFGLFMILRYSYSDLWNIDFDFMYWHVELSIVMSVLGLSHLLRRWKVYILQLGKNR